MGSLASGRCRQAVQWQCRYIDVGSKDLCRVAGPKFRDHFQCRLVESLFFFFFSIVLPYVTPSTPNGSSSSITDNDVEEVLVTRPGKRTCCATMVCSEYTAQQG